MTRTTSSTKAGDDVDVLGELRQLIVSRVYPPGSSLRETALAEQFGVPRTRIREVLSGLEQRGLVERTPNLGAVVARIGIDDLLHLYDVRGPLEGLAVRQATENAPAGSWDALIRQFNGPMESFVAEGDFDSFVEGYEEFRKEVLLAAANPVLVEMLGNLQDRSQAAIRRIIILPGRAEVGLREHQDVLAAMARGDAEEAETLRRSSIRSAKEFLFRYQKFVL